MAQTEIKCNQGFLEVCTYRGDELGVIQASGIRFQVWTDENKNVPYDLSLSTILIQVKKKPSNRTSSMVFDSENPNGTSIDMTDAANGVFTLHMTSQKSKDTSAFPRNPETDDPYVFDIQIATPRVETVTQADISAADTTNLFNRASGDWQADGFTEATKVKVSGFTDEANNGFFDVVSVTANDIEVSQLLVTEAIGPSVTIEMMTPDTRSIFTFVRGTWVHIEDVSRVLLA